MSDLKEVRSRIKKRRGLVQEEERSSFTLVTLFYRVVMVLMCLVVLCLGVLLNQKLHLIQMPLILEKFSLQQLSSWIPMEQWFSLKEQAVSSVPVYTPIKENQYTNGANTVYNTYDGVVKHIEKLQNNRYDVTLQQDNGVLTTYGNLMEVNVKEEERILKSSILGTYESYITIDFMKDGKSMNYEEALQTTN